MEVQVVGIDCATEDAKVGIACGRAVDTGLRVERALLCSRDESAAETVTSWVRATDVPTLLAVDAPLGWPLALAQALGAHRAGDAIATDANKMFRRETDRFVKTRLGKTPLDVGADRIARTAHAALRLLGDLRSRLAADVPLAWTPNLVATVSAIEVYPAATLVGHGFRAGGYKQRERLAERREIIACLQAIASLPDDLSSMERSADALDAVVCLLAAHDFLRGEAMPPENHVLATGEGWIWAKARTESNSTVQLTRAAGPRR